MAKVDSIKKANINEFMYMSDYGLILSSEYKTVEALDSARNVLEGTENEIIWLEYLGHKKVIDLANYLPERIWEMFLDAFAKNFPKSLFLFLPLFALVIMLFHRKQSWIYFDHAIFTLHFFSFLLLSLCANVLLGNLAGWIVGGHDTTLFYDIKTVLIGGICIWTLLYFFRAHHLMYAENASTSRMKAFGIFFMNLVLFAIIFLGVFIITLLNLH